MEILTLLIYIRWDNKGQGNSDSRFTKKLDKQLVKKHCMNLNIFFNKKLKISTLIEFWDKEEKITDSIFFN